MPTLPSPLTWLLNRTAKIEARELPAVIAAFALIFCVMCGYFSVRSVRETAGTLVGRDRVADLWVMVWIASLLIVPAYGWLVARLRRAVFLPLIYSGVALALALIGFIMQTQPNNLLVLEFFYVFISVLSLFMPSIFWAFMLELFTREQTRRLFGVIFAGGSAGALLGPWITAGIVRSVGNSGILYLGAALFVAAVLCQRALLRVWQQRIESAGQPPEDRPLGGNPLLDGVRLLFSSPYFLGIAMFVILLSAVSTFLYFEQLRIVSETFSDKEQRTQVFATLDAIVQTATTLLQLFITGRIAMRFGVKTLIIIVPFAMIFGFLALAATGTFMALAIVFCARRIGEYAFVRPAREMLFSVVSNQDRYRVKSVIDVPVYRGGDALSSQVQTGLDSAGMSPAQVAVVGAGVAAAWMINAWWLGTRFKKREADETAAS